MARSLEHSKIPGPHAKPLPFSRFLWRHGPKPHLPASKGAFVLCGVQSRLLTLFTRRFADSIAGARGARRDSALALSATPTSLLTINPAKAVVSASPWCL